MKSQIKSNDVRNTFHQRRRSIHETKCQNETKKYEPKQDQNIQLEIIEYAQRIFHGTMNIYIIYDNMYNLS